MTKSQATGGFGEEIAMAHLAGHGFRCVQYHFCCRFGEVDLIAEDGVFLVFAEVKTRRAGSAVRGEEAVDARKQVRLRTTAEAYLMTHETTLQPRLDVICVELAPNGQVAEIRWIENAF